MNLKDVIIELQTKVIDLTCEINELRARLMALESTSGKYINPPVYIPTIPQGGERNLVYDDRVWE